MSEPDADALRKLVETLAVVLGRYRGSLKEAGFSDQEAMSLIREAQMQILGRKG